MTQRPMVGKEFQNTRKILREAGGNGKRTTLHASLQVIIEHIGVHDKFAHALKARLNWSKNVRHKRDASFQFVLGLLNPTMYCV